MATRKFRADHLFTGHEMATANTVLITTEEGLVEALVTPEEAGQVPVPTEIIDPASTT